MSRLFTRFLLSAFPSFKNFSQLSENNSVLPHLTIKYLFFYSVKVIVAKARRIKLEPPVKSSFEISVVRL